MAQQRHPSQTQLDESSNRSPISDPSSQDLEKGDEVFKNRDDVESIATDTDEPISSDVQQFPSRSLLVQWEGQGDPEWPANFPRKRKFLITCTAAGLTLTVTFASSVLSAATVQLSEEFNMSAEVAVLTQALFICGFGVGPTFFGPLSELYGRKTPLFLGFVVFAIFQIPVGVAGNLRTVLISRFLQGTFGSSPTAVMGGLLADIWSPRERGFAMPSFAGVLFAGPILGPVVGAYITDSHLEWRWTAWITMIMAAFFGTIAYICVPETYAPVLLAQRAKRLRQTTGNKRFYAKHEEQEINLREIVHRYLTRPAKMLVLEPILALITLYQGFLFGLIYLFFVAYPISFAEDRGMDPKIASLPFFSILVGVLAGCVLLASTTNTRLSPNFEQGRLQETRLLLMIFGSIILPVGLFWFAWTSFSDMTPWPQIISGVPIGFSLIIVTLQGINYLIDSYTMYANSALAGMTFVRALFGAGFPLFAPVMFHNLGVQWATSTLAFISVALIPVPVLFYIFGARIRSWSKYVPK